MKIIKKIFFNKLVLILLIAFIFRLIISILPSHVDILSIGGWGRWIAMNGPMGFYQHNVWFYSWPTQPPLVNLLYGFTFTLFQYFAFIFTHIGYFIAINHLGASYILWYYDFVRWFAESFYLTTDFPIGFIISIKFFGIIGDLLIGLIIYLITQKFNRNKAIFFSLLYLFSPFTFYISSMWGQYDQLSYLFLLVSFISLLNKKTLLVAPLLISLSINLKPTSLIFVPLFIWIYLRQTPSIYVFIFGVFLSVSAFVFSALPFVVNKNVFDYINSEIIPRVIFKSEFRVSTNSFNFWHILIGNKALAHDELYLFIPAKIWGYLLFGYFNILAFKISRIVTAKNIFTSMFIIGMSGWLFLTSMLERYLFAGVTSGLILAIFYPRLLKYWLPLSLIFWINLYHSWWYPDFFDPLKNFLVWQESFLTRILSLINVFLFIKILQNIKIFPSIQKMIRIKQ
jgi:Gpi18-like mannosyltransferase